jgi:hypothetical protein
VSNEAESFLNRCPPPWQEFPAVEPQVLARYLTQGETEWWFDEVWRPFWGALSSEQKELYLEHWKATPEWREAMQVFEVDPDFDAGADARESEHYLAEMRRAREAQGKPSFLKRLFGSKK